jgi:hypothetical protein
VAIPEQRKLEKMNYEEIEDLRIKKVDWNT